MSGQYAPGTVAVATVRGVEGVRVVRSAEWSLTGWIAFPGGYYGDSAVTDVRPLVVLDAGLGGSWSPSGLRLAARKARDSYIDNAAILLGRLADAIEAQTKPPKPPEPQGLGAVVETADGEWFIRPKTTTTVAHWKRARGEDGSRRYRYDEINVVKVLCKGFS